jgi:hypothetical protein
VLTDEKSKGMNRRQTLVPRRDTTAPLLFQFAQEGPNLIG